MENDLAGCKRLLEAIFLETLELYPFIVEDGKEIPLFKAVEDALDSLPLSKGEKDAGPWKRGKRVLELRFGIGGEAHSRKKIANLPSFGVTEARIRAIELKHIRLLRHPSRSKRLRLFIIPLPP